MNLALGHLPVGPVHPLSMTGRPHAVVNINNNNNNNVLLNKEIDILVKIIN